MTLTPPFDTSGPYPVSGAYRMVDRRGDFDARQLQAAAALLTGCEMSYVSCRYWREFQGWTVQTRTVPDTFLLLPTAGAFQYRLEDAPAWYDVRPGQFLLLQDDRRHALRIHPDTPVLEQVSLHVHAWDPFHLPVVRVFRDPVQALPSGEVWERQFRLLCALHDAEPAAAAALGANLLPALLADLILHGAALRQSGSQGDPRVLDTLTHIREHLAADLGIPALAARVGLQEGRLRALFQQELGMSPKQYIMTERLRRAARLLRRSRRPVKAVAAEVGFASGAYFNRCFRRHYDRTPSDYRLAIGDL